MRAKDFLRELNSLPLRSLREAVPAGAIVVIAPHPDDESLGCGGLIAEALEEGREVLVIVVSDGSGSHPQSQAFPAERLAAVREEEACRSIEALGLNRSAVRFLRLPDRSVPYEGEEAENAIEFIAAYIRLIRAGSCFVSWRSDPHCDHQASFILAQRAVSMCPGCSLFEYTIWGANLPDETEVGSIGRGFRLDILRHTERKLAAVSCHRSQLGSLIDDDPSGFALGAADLDRLVAPTEAFFVEGSKI